MHEKSVKYLIAILIIINFAWSSLFAVDVPWASGLSKGEDLRIKLVTFDRGEDITSWWGHIAIIVEDVQYNKSRIYNFGLFSFGDGMLFKFAMGRLIFSAGDFNVPGYLLYYKKQNRDVRIAELNIPPQKRLQMAESLAKNVLPENKDYLYNHYDDNCATRLRDIIDDAVDGQLAKATKVPGRMTFRQHTKRYVAHNPLMGMLLMFLMNDSIDKPVLQWDEMFLPDELERYVKDLEYIDGQGGKQKLITNSFIFFKSKNEPVPSQPPSHWQWALMAGIILGVFAFSNALWNSNTISQWPMIIFGLYNILIGLVIGVPGLILSLMSSFTDHTVTYFNENLLLANPITFLILPLGIILALNKKWAVKRLRYVWYIQTAGVIAAILLKALPAFDQDNWLVIAFILPLYAGFAIAARMIEIDKKS